MTPQWLSVIFPWFNPSTSGVVRRSSVGLLVRALTYLIIVCLSGWVGSNHRPIAYQASALPTELQPVEADGITPFRQSHGYDQSLSV